MRILVIRTSALGDVVHALPALAALRRHLPDARIGWVVEQAMAPLLEGHPELDDLLVVSLRAWRRRPFATATLSGVRRFLGELRRFAPEVVIDLMGNHKAGVIGALTLCDRRLGAARTHRREPSSAIWINEPVEPAGEHAIERAISLLAPLGVPAGAADLAGDHLFQDALPPATPERFFLLHPGAGWPNKRYPAELWGEAARRLAEATGVAGLVVGGPAESDLVAVAQRTSRGALERIDTPDLASLAALLRRADLVLAGDTGPLHLAHSMGTPVLCLMGPTDPSTHGPYGRPESALWHRLPCSFCHKRLDSPKPCLTLLAPESVAERAAGLLGV